MTLLANDPDLLRRFRAGDREALSAVYRHYVACVERLVRRCHAPSGWAASGQRTGADRADIVQDVFAKAFAERARAAYEPSRPYRPYLLTVARNVIVDRVRQLQRESRIDVQAIHFHTEMAASEPSSALPWADPHTLRLVDRYLDGLATDERAVYVERYCRCSSQSDAAAALGISRQRVRTLESRLRSGLARELSRASLGSALFVPAKSQPVGRLRS
jgi:RNA polymerase sigma factor (sigma-70 family)